MGIREAGAKFFGEKKNRANFVCQVVLNVGSVGMLLRRPQLSGERCRAMSNQSIPRARRR